jgi:hypothetical protein
MRHPLRLALPLLALATIAAAGALGPPRITVRAVTGTPPTADAVLEVISEHHTTEGDAETSAQAIAVRNGTRVTSAITLTPAGAPGRYGVTRQWEAGTAWVLLFRVTQGDHGAHGVAEALVRVDAMGRIGEITHARASNLRGDRYPRAFTEREIDEALRGR